MRTTKAEVVAVFKNWVEAIGGHEAKDWKDVGGYQLDHNGIYGGYQVVRICNEHGGQSDNVFLSSRLTAYYFTQALRASIRSIEQLRLNSEVK